MQTNFAAQFFLSLMTHHERARAQSSPNSQIASGAVSGDTRQQMLLELALAVGKVIDELDFVYHDGVFGYDHLCADPLKLPDYLISQMSDDDWHALFVLETLPGWLPELCKKYLSENNILIGNPALSQSPTIQDLHAQWLALDKEVSDAARQMQAEGWSSRDIENELYARYKQKYYWHNAILKPIACRWEELGWFARVEVLGPFGIGAHVAFHCYAELDDSEPVSLITFSSLLKEDPETTILQVVVIGEDTGAYKPGTIGHLNDLGAVHRDIPNDLRIDDTQQWKQFLQPLKVEEIS